MGLVIQNVLGTGCLFRTKGSAHDDTVLYKDKGYGHERKLIYPWYLHFHFTKILIVGYMLLSGYQHCYYYFFDLLGMTNIHSDQIIKLNNLLALGMFTFF